MLGGVVLKGSPLESSSLVMTMSRWLNCQAVDFFVGDAVCVFPCWGL